MKWHGFLVTTRSIEDSREKILINRFDNVVQVAGKLVIICGRHRAKGSSQPGRDAVAVIALDFSVDQDCEIRHGYFPGFRIGEHGDGIPAGVGLHIVELLSIWLVLPRIGADDDQPQAVLREKLIYLRRFLCGRNGEHKKKGESEDKGEELLHGGSFHFGLQRLQGEWPMLMTASRVPTYSR